MSSSKRKNERQTPPAYVTTRALTKIWAQAADFHYGGVDTRAWARWEHSEAWVFQGFLHGDLWKKKKGKYALNLILKMNGLNGRFKK